MKSLKQLVRNVIDPGRDLGHVDRHHNEKKPGSTSDQQPTPTPTGQSSTGETADDQDQTLPTTDADAAVVGDIASEAKENRKENDAGAGEACEDCK